MTHNTPITLGANSPGVQDLKESLDAKFNSVFQSFIGTNDRKGLIDAIIGGIDQFSDVNKDILLAQFGKTTIFDSITLDEILGLSIPGTNQTVELFQTSFFGNSINAANAIKLSVTGDIQQLGGESTEDFQIRVAGLEDNDLLSIRRELQLELFQSERGVGPLDIPTASARLPDVEDAPAGSGGQTRQRSRGVGTFRPLFSGLFLNTTP